MKSKGDFCTEAVEKDQIHNGNPVATPSRSEPPRAPAPPIQAFWAMRQVCGPSALQYGYFSFHNTHGNSHIFTSLHTVFSQFSWLPYSATACQGRPS